MNPSLQIRDELIRFLGRELVGPEGEEGEVLRESPCQRYSAGILFPSRQPVSPVDDLAERDGDGPDDEKPFEVDVSPETGAESRRSGGDEETPDAAYDDPVLLANSYLPSAIGLTFVVADDVAEIQVHPFAATYESKREARSGNSGTAKETWVRQPLELPPQVFHLGSGDRASAQRRDVVAGRLSLSVVTHPGGRTGRVVTVSMFNKICGEGAHPRARNCFFQASFRVTAPSGERPFTEYHHLHRPLDDPEEQSMALLYRNRRTYALGHGCAADWGEDVEGRTDSVETAILPVVKVPPVLPRSGTGEELSMELLAGLDGDEGGTGRIASRLGNLVSMYRDWIEGLERELESIPDTLVDRARSHVGDCRKTLARMEEGIEILRQDARALEAFTLANRAMLMQQSHHRRPRRTLDDEWTPFPKKYRSVVSGAHTSGYWRTFQLAFILMNLPAFLPSGQDDSRDVVDLIWFPTGGGKTEAYLGLAAYCIFLRRLLKPSNAGCTVLMRYTLRLLTSQQFQRASSLICACELLRQEDPARRGDDPITIGLWVGKSLSPNTRQQAIHDLNALPRKGQEATNPFQILTCPWCGTAMDQPRRLGYRLARLGNGSRVKTVRLVCPEKQCSFNKLQSPLPILVIDEDIYDRPPTLLLGTVDKFAMLAWRPESGSLFGLRGNTDRDPPDLIIQDELHLISGPLGSMVGLYESTVDLLCSHRGRRPKIVASTATIRRATEQCRALYDRPAFQFPPPGLDVSDSFFAREETEAAGRTYVGVLPASISLPVTAQVRTASALLQGIRTVPLPEDAGEGARDPYWTLLQYFGSLRELGLASTLVEADIPEHISVMTRRMNLRGDKRRWLGFPVELTSRRTAAEIPKILQQLEVTYPRLNEGAPWPLDTLLATNMISVGVDVDRLGLMLVVGQPKTTAEYIQATSRVGRTEGAPGLVVTLYNRGRPRDRSHYEQFRGYHQAFYRHVEPTSVTPYSLPSLDRALHALLVIAARHLAGVSTPEDFNPDSSEIRKFVEFLASRVERIDPEHAVALEQRLQARIHEWKGHPRAEWGNFGTPPENVALMYPAGREPPHSSGDMAWAVPSSMRSVDAECRADVVQVLPAGD